MNPDPIRPVIFLVAIIAALAMAPVAPEAGNILYLVAAGLALLFLRSSDIRSFRRPIVWMPLAGLGILAVTYALAAGSLQGAVGIFFFAPFLAIWPLLALAKAKGQLDATTIVVLSLCGVAGAAAAAMAEVLTTGTVRAGSWVANPIHFADVALAGGFLATLGAVYGRGNWRYLYFSGPIFAGIAVLLSGTRGAVVSLALMAGTAFVVAIILRMITRRMLAIGGLAAIVVVIAAMAAGAGQTSGMQRVMADVVETLQTGLPTDESTALRLQMYEGGFKAFLASPLIGHGPFAYVEAAASRVTPPFVGAPHLHNDIADFAASGGIFGLIAYFLLLLAP
ncbi:MAG TPA: O-antigen ligase family protein, partial [Devosia sp.]|nr:O-antigen ligase family protein [Devosia sp.]